MSTILDGFGRTITIITTNGLDTYSFTIGSISVISGTSQALVLSTINALAPGNYAASLGPLNTQYTPVQFGNFLMTQTISTMAGRGLTAAQRFTFIQTAVAYIALLQAGDISGFIAKLPSIVVDGTIVKASDITYLTNQATNYLNGS